MAKTKTIHYKNSFITGDVVLQDALLRALDKNGIAGKPNSRQQKTNTESDTVIFINKVSDYNGMTFCQLVVLESGKQQPFITVDDDADFYSIDTLTSEKIPGEEKEQGVENTLSPVEVKEAIAKKRREFLDSILYFGVVGNHMVVLQSAQLRSRELEAHLFWLLGTCTSVVANNSMLVLKDKPAETVFQKMQGKPVKSIRVGAPLTSDVSTDPSEPQGRTTEEFETTETHANKVRFVPTGMAASILRAALPEGFMERLELEDSLDEANIHVALEITYMRKTTKIGQKVIDSLATSLRHMPESDVEVNLQGGGKIKGDELKLSGNISVKFSDKGLIDESLLVHEMHSWLFSKISAAEIDAGEASGG